MWHQIPHLMLVSQRILKETIHILEKQMMNMNIKPIHFALSLFIAAAFIPQALA
jgi:hypothetical protein